jgi:hypothetical protein
MVDLSRHAVATAKRQMFNIIQDFLRFYQTFFFDRNLQDYSETLFLEISNCKIPKIFPEVLPATSGT